MTGPGRRRGVAELGAPVEPTATDELSEAAVQPRLEARELFGDHLVHRDQHDETNGLGFGGSRLGEGRHEGGPRQDSNHGGPRRRTSRKCAQGKAQRRARVGRLGRSQPTTKKRLRTPGKSFHKVSKRPICHFAISKVSCCALRETHPWSGFRSDDGDDPGGTPAVPLSARRPPRSGSAWSTARPTSRSRQVCLKRIRTTRVATPVVRRRSRLSDRSTTRLARTRRTRKSTDCGNTRHQLGRSSGPSKAEGARECGLGIPPRVEGGARSPLRGDKVAGLRRVARSWVQWGRPTNRATRDRLRSIRSRRGNVRSLD